MQPNSEVSCVDLEQERLALLAQHATARGAHFETNVELILANIPETSLDVRDGEVTTITRQQFSDLFTRSFTGATYQEWDDLEPPIIHISADATMAWMIDRVKVRRTKQDASGVEAEERFVYSGLTVYEKRDGRWMRVANASTFAEG